MLVIASGYYQAPSIVHVPELPTPIVINDHTILKLFIIFINGTALPLIADISFLFLLRMGDGQFLITTARWYGHMQSYAIKRLNFQNCMRQDIERSIVIRKFTSRQTDKHRYDSTSMATVIRI